MWLFAASLLAVFEVTKPESVGDISLMTAYPGHGMIQ
jgi:hypothetical protein